MPKLSITAAAKFNSMLIHTEAVLFKQRIPCDDNVFYSYKLTFSLITHNAKLKSEPSFDLFVRSMWVIGQGEVKSIRFLFSKIPIYLFKKAFRTNPQELKSIQ